MTADPSEIVQASNKLPAANFAKAFISATTGVGKMTTMELLTAADILPQEVRLETSACQSLAQVIGKLQTDLQAQAAKHPVYALIRRTNQVKPCWYCLRKMCRKACRSKNLPISTVR